MQRSLLVLFIFLPFFALAQVPQIVINELDYDQPSTDVAEFIEIKNLGPDPIPMSSVSIDLINGANGGAAVYLTLEGPNWPLLMPNEYFVVCGNSGFTTNCDADVTPDDNLIQNGSPDAVALRGGLTIFDVLSYEGSVPGFTEVSGDSLEDPFWGGVGGFNEDKSLSRFPDGQDSNNNNIDFQVSCITPGEANISDTTDCGLSTAIPDPVESTDQFFAYTIPQQDLLMFNIDQADQGRILVELFDLNGKLLMSDQGPSSRNWSGGFPIGHLSGQVLLIRAITERSAMTQRIWID